ncbi:MAG: exodeoxyribonuclease VII small subunit [Pseudomonadota bacterium]|tara:strand:- start:171 stop:422 length:252 start_codon:yes stop_codon:yes gene_type:complete
MSEKKNTNQKVDFEKLINQLKEVLVKLESGDLSLEESMKEFEKGVEINTTCQSLLDKASQRVEQVTKKNEKIISEPFLDENDE